ncbi:MAG: LysM domain-containing protein [Chloroflexota bacterium]|jgi:hypothetical protein
MRKIVILSLVILSLLLAACSNIPSLPIPVDDNGNVVVDGTTSPTGNEPPRIEATPTPPLPPTFTPSAMAHQGHLYLLPVSGADGSIQYVHIVRAGDTLAALCQMYGVSLKDVMFINSIADANLIEVGDALVIPIGGS